jgi:hypothetical protein
VTPVDPDEDSLPGLSTRYMPLILLLPALILVAFGLGFLFPSFPAGPLIAGSFVLTAVTTLVVAVHDRNRKRRKAGLVPKKEGFSAKVELLATKLRERADEIDQAVQFNRHVNLPFPLQGYLDEIRKTASEVDHRQILADLDVSVPLNLTDAVATSSHVQKLRDVSAELETYAADVRKRGGIYRVNAKQRIGCFAFISLVFLGGAYLIWISQVWWGVAVLGIAVFGLWAAIGSQSEQA